MDTERYELWAHGRQLTLLDTLPEARAAFLVYACNTCLLDGGRNHDHCGIYDREDDRYIRAVSIYSGSDLVYSTYAAPCEACGTEFFDVEMGDSLCIECRVRVAA